MCIFISCDLLLVNDSKPLMMYLIIFFWGGGVICSLNFFYDASPTESEIFENATNQTSNNNEETGNQEETAVSKNQNCTKILLG